MLRGLHCLCLHSDTQQTNAKKDKNLTPFLSPLSKAKLPPSTETERQPCADGRTELNGTQVSSRLIWKLCNEGPTVYI